MRLVLVILLFASSTINSVGKAYILIETDDIIKHKTLSSSSAHELIYPGSTLKPFLAEYILETQYKKTYNAKYFCQGWSKKLTLHHRACWLKKGHALLNLSEAIAHSCNYYFYNISRNVKRRDFFYWMKKKYHLNLNSTKNGFEYFPGENLSEKILFTELFQSYLKLFFNSKHKHKFIKDGLKLALSEGTLLKFTDRLSHKPFGELFTVNYGKTGTYKEKKILVGLAFIMFTSKLSHKKYVLGVMRENVAGSKAASKYGINLIAKFVKEDIIK